ncbi:hypothetical protein ACWC10_07325 [Streptomyces sp. NPDC001595]|uniref:hypothetical protein n=1 Tax=Streptomyces sp. NPDC001532 TaxID=3154520 RepID=UPI00331F2B70
MAWDEWEQLKSEAVRHRQDTTGMQLNHVADPGGAPYTPQGDLEVGQSDLAAIGNAAYELYQAFDHYGDHARANSQKAADGLRSEGYEIGSALDHVAQRWVDQVQSLLDATAHISNHLDYTKGAHAGDEVHIAGVLSGIETLDRGFDERKAD